MGNDENVLWGAETGHYSFWVNTNVTSYPRFFTFDKSLKLFSLSLKMKIFFSCSPVSRGLKRQHHVLACHRHWESLQKLRHFCSPTPEQPRGSQLHNQTKHTGYTFAKPSVWVLHKSTSLMISTACKLLLRILSVRSFASPQRIETLVLGEILTVPLTAQRMHS